MFWKAMGQSVIEEKQSPTKIIESESIGEVKVLMAERGIRRTSRAVPERLR
jgi:hypothetical protein